MFIPADFGIPDALGRNTESMNPGSDHPKASVYTYTLDIPSSFPKASTVEWAGLGPSGDAQRQPGAVLVSGPRDVEEDGPPTDAAWLGVFD